MKKRSTTADPPKTSKGGMDSRDSEEGLEMQESFEAQMAKGTFFESLDASGYVLDDHILERVAKEAWS